MQDSKAAQKQVVGQFEIRNRTLGLERGSVRAHSEFMPKRTFKLDQLKAKADKLTKQHLAVHASITKTKARLDASQNALRVVEQAIGGKLISKPNLESSRRRSN